jgi:hypothetical protein
MATKSKESPVHSIELEWDNDFVPANCDTEQTKVKRQRTKSNTKSSLGHVI